MRDVASFNASLLKYVNLHVLHAVHRASSARSRKASAEWINTVSDTIVYTWTSLLCKYVRASRKEYSSVPLMPEGTLLPTGPDDKADLSCMQQDQPRLTWALILQTKLREVQIILDEESTGQIWSAFAENFNLGILVEHTESEFNSGVVFFSHEGTAFGIRIMNARIILFWRKSTTKND